MADKSMKQDREVKKVAEVKVKETPVAAVKTKPEKSSAASGGASTALKTCTCSHSFQNERYGNGRRIMNSMKDRKGYRCTVCAKVSST